MVLYDDDCGFCKRLLSKFLAWDRRGLLRPVALQDPEADRLLGEMAEERKMASWHLVTPDGEVRSGGAAIAPLLRLLPGGAAPAWIVDRIPTLTDRSYRWVAANRTALSRRLPRWEAGKRRAERRIESRSGQRSSSPGTSAQPASPRGAGDPPGEG
jgi:predicted DCC family thiol-disulfide oxidoreductase YuxK